MPLKFKPINESWIYGVECTHETRHVQVVRAYSNDWRIFGTIDGRTMRESMRLLGDQLAEGLCYQSALKLARRILSGEITPEIWP